MEMEIQEITFQMGGGYGEWGESLLNTANINMSEINSGFER